MLAQSSGWSPDATEHLSPEKLRAMRVYRDTYCIEGSRSRLRLNGGWESMLRDVFDTSCTLPSSPFATATPLFSGESSDCFGLGASPLGGVELIVDQIGSTRNPAGPCFFVRTDLFQQPSTEFLDVVHDMILGETPVSFVVAHCYGVPSAWTLWIDKWTQQGRASLLARVPLLKLTQYGA